MIRYQMDVGTMTPMPRRPATTPIGLHLTRTARLATNAFERAMSEAGGSAAAFQVLVLVRSGQWGKQAGLAGARGAPGAHLTPPPKPVGARGVVPPRPGPAHRPGPPLGLPHGGPARFDP